MRRFALVLLLLLGCAAPERLTPLLPVYYTRCNLRILDREVSATNWQAPYLKILPVNTPIEAIPARDVEKGPAWLWVLKDRTADVSLSARLDLGNANSAEKILTAEPVPLSRWDEATQEAIRKGSVFSGMAKEAAYVALGPPPIVMAPQEKWKYSSRLTFEEIMKSDDWVYARKRSSKFLVHFDGGKVDRVE